MNSVKVQYVCLHCALLEGVGIEDSLLDDFASGADLVLAVMRR